MKKNLKKQLAGLYVITSPELIHADNLLSAVANAIAGGAKLVQYRNKIAGFDRKLWEAHDLANLCRTLDIPLIINDDVEIALRVKAAGVHLGKDDDDILSARKALGPEAIIGISCYNSMTKAVDAEKRGADYVAFGRFYPSATKPEAVQADPDLLLRAKSLDIPIAAVGGINAANCRTLIRHGADMVAVIEGVFGSEDIKAAAKEIARVFS